MIKKFIKKIGKGIKKVGKAIGKPFKKLMKTKIGKIIGTIGMMMIGGWICMLCYPGLHHLKIYC